MGCEKGLGRPATLVAQHAQEVPLGVELRGITKFRHDFAGDAMNALLPNALPQNVLDRTPPAAHSNHPQFLEQPRIERDLVDAVEDLTCTAGCAGCRSTGLTCTRIVNGGVHCPGRGAGYAFD